MRARRLSRGRLGTALAVLLTSLVLAPAADSHPGPHDNPGHGGTPPGQTAAGGSGSSANAPGSQGSSPSPSAGNPGKGHGNGNSGSTSSPSPTAPVNSTSAGPSSPGNPHGGGSPGNSGAAHAAKGTHGNSGAAHGAHGTASVAAGSAGNGNHGKGNGNGHGNTKHQSPSGVAPVHSAPVSPPATTTPVTTPPATSPPPTTSTPPSHSRTPGRGSHHSTRPHRSHTRTRARTSHHRTPSRTGTRPAVGAGVASAARAGATAAGATPAAAPRPTAQRVQRRSSHHRGGTGIGHELSSLPALAGNLFGLPLPVPDWSKPIILVLLLVCVALAFRAWLMSRRARRLEDERVTLSADLELMQAALVPAIPAQLGALGVSVAYRPADGPAAGGDFYDAFALPGGRAAFIVGDVSGHGRSALARAAHMHYTLRAYVETGLDPRSALKLAGRVLEPEGNGLFTTVVVAIYDAASATLTYASAGHPAPIFLGPGAREPLTGAGSPPIGWGAATGRRQTTVPFPEGARAYLFSDGLIESRADGELLGREGLQTHLERTDREADASALLRWVETNSDSVRDDMAACVIEALSGTPRSEHRFEELELDRAQLSAGHGDSFLAACGVPEEEASVVLASAHAVAAEQGSVVLLVEQTGQSASASAAAPMSISLGGSGASMGVTETRSTLRRGLGEPGPAGRLPLA